MHTKVPNVRGLMAVIAGAVISLAAPAYAANFAVSPMDVTLGRGERSQTIVMTNQDEVPLRFQLKAYRWDERPDGQMVLTPTDDVIFFPQLFDLAPHQAQNIWVGTIEPALSRRTSGSPHGFRPANSDRATIAASCCGRLPPTGSDD